MTNYLHDSSPNSDPHEIYRRQIEREHLVPTWFDLLGVAGGTRFVDIGSGPGRITHLAAERVGPNGTVYALDRDPNALRYLARKAAKNDLDTVQPIVTDATALGLHFDRPVVALVAFMLHHTTHPPPIFDELAETLAADSCVLVVEYDPEASGAVGPALDQRIALDRIDRWLVEAGFTVEGRYDLEEECYGVIARIGH